MKLYIDMIAFYLQKAGGITNVWSELLIRMMRDKKEIVLILQKSECNNIHFKHIMAFNPKVIYDTGNNVKINRYFPVRCELESGCGFISTYYRVVNYKDIRQYTLVHDFIYEHYVKGIRKQIHSEQKRRSIQLADVIIGVSNNTMSDLINLYPWAKQKKRFVIYNGVSEEYKKIEREMNVDELGEYNWQKFLVYVGSRAKYKRFDFAVDIAEHFGCALVIIGGGQLSVREDKELNNKLKYRYIHINDIQNAELNKIYNKAFALLYPSEYEGFGLPIIEAQRAGCPVIARRGSSIDEVYGNCDNLMRENTMMEAERIMNLLNDNNKRKDFCKQGYVNSKRFDWEKTYAEIEKILC